MGSLAYVKNTHRFLFHCLGGHMLRPMKYMARRPIAIPIQTSAGYLVLRIIVSKIAVKESVRMVIDMTSWVIPM